VVFYTGASKASIACTTLGVIEVFDWIFQWIMDINVKPSASHPLRRLR